MEGVNQAGELEEDGRTPFLDILPGTGSRHEGTSSESNADLALPCYATTSSSSHSSDCIHPVTHLKNLTSLPTISPPLRARNRMNRASRSSTASLFDSSTSTSVSSATSYSNPSVLDSDDGSFLPANHLPSSHSFHPLLSPSLPSTNMSTRASGSSATKPRKERQTRLQEHLRTVKGSRGISPAANAKARAAPPPVQETVASGRPRRKAAARVVMQEVGSDSEEDDRSEASEEEEDQDVEVEEEEEEEQTRPRRGRRSAGGPAPKRVSSVDDFSPAVKSTSARKSPVKQSPTKSLRSRQVSNSSIDVEAMNESDVQRRLRREKEELMVRLAQHGCVFFLPLAFPCSY